jgi:hypothetical protein
MWTGDRKFGGYEVRAWVSDRGWHDNVGHTRTKPEAHAHEARSTCVPSKMTRAPRNRRIVHRTRTVPGAKQNRNGAHPIKCVAPAAIAAVASSCQLFVWSAVAPQSMGTYCLPAGTLPPGLEAQLYIHETLRWENVSACLFWVVFGCLSSEGTKRDGIEWDGRHRNAWSYRDVNVGCDDFMEGCGCI